ncbi:MAG TPA: tryptophan--tRNA ligase [Dehalococcoidales bacterium]
MKRVFSGTRPTGKLHLGNYLGAIQNYVKLQDEFECVYCIVDWHALTTMTDTSELQNNIHEMALDWLAAGIDPQRTIMFVQSHVPEVTELHLALSMITPLSWLLRVPTFKDKAKQQPENINYGLVGYPVLQTADIILYKAEVVPVGEDQLPHLELAREIVRRFNTLMGPTFPEPVAKLTSFPNVIGLDGKDKMSKSLNNYLEISASPEEITAKIKTAVTDPARVYRKDIGHPSVCNIYRFQEYFNPSQLAGIAQKCTTAEIGCVECKTIVSREIIRALEPFRQKRAELAAKPEYVKKILTEGAERARVIARETLSEVKQRIGLA